MKNNLAIPKPTKRGRPLKMTTKARKDAAWVAMSLWVRLSNVSHLDLVPCYTCFRENHYKEMDAGHGINSRSNSVLFMEEIVKPQCTYCNRYLGGNYKVFTTKLIKELGIKRWEELLNESNKVVKMTPMEFLEIENLYKRKLEELNAIGVSTSDKEVKTT